MRVLANYDWQRYEQILRWPVAEALESYENHLRTRARHEHEIAMLCWTIIAPHAGKKGPKPPKPPPILKD